MVRACPDGWLKALRLKERDSIRQRGQHRWPERQFEGLVRTICDLYRKSVFWPWKTAIAAEPSLAMLGIAAATTASHVRMEIAQHWSDKEVGKRESRPRMIRQRSTIVAEIRSFREAKGMSRHLPIAACSAIWIAGTGIANRKLSRYCSAGAA